MGNEYLYQMLAKENIETLDRYAVKTDRHRCPHCFHQIGNEYPQLGGNYDVIHHSTFIERLLKEGRVPLGQPTRGKRLTIAYHDSCYLGRYNDVYDAPRETLRTRAAGDEARRAASARATADCAAAPAAAGCSWRRRVGKRINVERTEELLATGAGRDRRRVPVLHDDDERRREGGEVQRAGGRHRRSGGGAARDAVTAVLGYWAGEIPSLVPIARCELSRSSVESPPPRTECRPAP